MTPTWLIGRGGLLGSALARTLGDCEFQPSQRLRWNTAELSGQLRAEAQELARVVQHGAERWQVCWCAGAGVVGSSESALAGETVALRALLTALADERALRETPGTFLLSSSAGGVYGDSAGPRIDESSEPRPISAYGRAKLEQEQALTEACARFSGLSTLTARLANLYGPGQRLDKPQGLISHMARSVVSGQPVQIYVPLDTMRDYLFADDAARMLAAGLRRLGSGEPRHVLKIYASERDTSIARLLDIFRSIAKRRLRVVSGLHATSLQQPRRLSFRSQLWPEDRDCLRTDLVAGVGLVFRQQLQAFQAGGPVAGPVGL